MKALLNSKSRKSIIADVFIWSTLMFASSLLFTGCGSAAPAGSETPEYRYQADANSALLHIYRNSFAGMAVSYDLYFDNEFVFNVTNKSKITIRVVSEGIHTLWAETEAKTELQIDVRFGNEYYVKCGVGMGILVGRPKMELVHEQTGYTEYYKIKVKQ
jgi:hypothetical protein